MFWAGFTFALNHNYKFSLGPDLGQTYFYLDFNQESGPRFLPTTLNLGGGDILPEVLLYGDEATDTIWPNRGTAGGDFIANNIRSQDLGIDTPFSQGSAVRLQSDVGVTRRCYEAPNTTIADFNNDDFIIEIVYCREAGTVGTPLGKRNIGSSTNVGWQVTGSTTTNMTLQVRPTGDALRTSTSTTTIDAWHHVIAYFDQDDLTTTGMRTYTGSQTSATSTHTVQGSVTNAVPLRIGAEHNASILAQDCTIAYIAIWRGASILPGGVNNNIVLTPIIRARQQLLAGFVPATTNTPTNIKHNADYITKVVDGKMKAFRCGVGCATISTTLMSDKVTPQRGGNYHTAIALTSGLNPETFAAWTKTNLTLTNNAFNAPCQPTIASQGSSAVGTATTATMQISLATLLLGTGTTNNILQMFVKPGDKTNFYFACSDGATQTNRFVYYSLTGTGSITSIGSGLGTQSRAFITPYVDGWYQCVFIFENTTETSPTLSAGFCDASGSFACTGDGSTINGYLYGVQFAQSSVWPVAPLPIALNETSTAPVHSWSGALISAQPTSLWAETFSPAAIPNSAATTPILFASNATTDFAGLQLAASTTLYQIQTVGTAASVSQWTVSGAGTGAGSIASGNKVTQLAAINTNDIQLYSQIASLGTDTTATIPTAPITTISVGSNQSATVGGINLFVTRAAVFNTRKTNADAP